MYLIICASGIIIPSQFRLLSGENERNGLEYQYDDDWLLSGDIFPDHIEGFLDNLPDTFTFIPV